MPSSLPPANLLLTPSHVPAISHQPWATTHPATRHLASRSQAFWSGLSDVGLGTRGQGDLARLQAAYHSQCSLLYTHCAHLARLALEFALTLTIARTLTVARTLTTALSHYLLLLLLLLLLPPPAATTTSITAAAAATTTTTTAGALLAPGQRLCAPTRRGPATSPLHRARGAPLVITPPPRGM